VGRETESGRVRGTPEGCRSHGDRLSGERAAFAAQRWPRGRTHEIARTDQVERGRACSFGTRRTNAADRRRASVADVCERTFTSCWSDRSNPSDSSRSVARGGGGVRRKGW